MLLRDWRAGELRVLALGLVLAVGGVTSVAFFADRVRQALTREAHQVLGAERMMAALKVRRGDAIEVGRARLRVAAVLTLEPDRGVSFTNFAPRLMMRLDDLPATGLVQPGSRINYQLLAAGEREGIRQFEQWAKPRLGRGERIDSLENARPEVRAGLDRAQSFLGLSAMLAVVLSAVAVALGTRRYSERHLDGYAVMRCMGASQSQLFALFA